MSAKTDRQSLAIPSVPNPELLEEYRRVASELPALVIAEWSARHSRRFRYALTSLIIGGVLALSLVSGFVFLVMKDQGKYAAGLLCAGAFTMVAGFLSTRFRD